MKKVNKITSFILIFFMMLFISSVKAEENNEIYLSDIPDDKRIVTKSGWGNILKDKASDNSKLSVKVEGAYYTFDKGMWAHATSTLVYDISEYSNNYKYFSAYVGLNRTAASSSNGVIFKIYTSNDNKNWALVKETDIIKAGDNAEFAQIDITNVHYLKLVADSNGANGNDHSVYADAKLTKTEVSNNATGMNSLEWYDNELKTIYSDCSPERQNTCDDVKYRNYELTLLQRTFVKRIGGYALKRFTEESEDNKNVLNWLFNDVDNLNMYILGGTPDGGSYYNSLNVLSRLYKNYNADLNNTSSLNNTWQPNLTYGDLYKKMMITLSLTHSQRVALWMQPGEALNQSDPVKRYAIYRALHKKSKEAGANNTTGGFRATANVDITPWFESLSVEEMRYVMNNLIDDDEILWLNDYVQTKIDASPNSVGGLLTPHPYMAYVWPNYGNPVYYASENKNYFNELFAVNKTNYNSGTELTSDNQTGKIGLFDVTYTIPGGVDNSTYTFKLPVSTIDHKVYKVWMNFRNQFGTGAVCGGISKTGSNIRATHGIPATVIGQPGHAALLYYSKDANGKGYWGIDNDVSGWSLSEKGERLLLGWGNANTDYARGSYQVVYVTLAQEALNDYENFEKSEKLVMLADVYNNDLVTKEAIYRKAINAQSINIDAWYGLITLYNNSTVKDEDAYYALADEVAENLKDYPLPMYQLTNLIKPKLKSNENVYKFTLLQDRMLKYAKSLVKTDLNSRYWGATVTEANYLLGKTDNSIATFSFDGEDAGKIVLSSRFDGNGVRWDYSLDGKQTWTEVAFTAEEPHKLELTPEQISSITSTNDIYVHIVGVGYEEKNLYKIDITEQTLPETLYANDLENSIIGVNNNVEWRIGNTPWKSYSNEIPDLTGDKSIEIRVAANGTKLTSPSQTYTFTKDSTDLTRKYVPISRLSIDSFSTEATGQKRYATNAIDGNYNTNWHSAWNGTDTERFITIKVNRPIYLSEVEYVPAGGGNGKIYDGTIYGSMDGVNWEVLTTVKNLIYKGDFNADDNGFINTKNIKVESSSKVQYIKIVANRASNGNWFTARMFNIYEDASKLPKNPTAEISYSTTNSTNDEVIATLVNPSTKITITNNNGFDTYRFTDNGSFTFEFVDENGLKGTAVATVNWIDKDTPKADVDYNIDNDNKLMILLDGISENVYLLDKDNKKINYIEVKNGKVSSISYLDANGTTYKTIEVDESGKVTKVMYENTTGSALIVDKYVTFLQNGVVTSDAYLDAEGNNIKAGDSYVNSSGHRDTLTESELIPLKSLQQPITSPLEYTFDNSGDYEFKFMDEASNIAFKSIKVDYIDNSTTILASDITYDITKLTNKNVVATINPYIIDSSKKGAIVVNNNSSKTYTFIDNGTFTFEYKDETDTEGWEIKTHTAVVDWIDKTLPTAEIKYSTKEETDKVVVTLVNESETIKIINNGGSREYTFTENGTFAFEIEDLAGNINRVIASVDNIKKEEIPDDKGEDKSNDNKPSEVKPTVPTKPNRPGTIEPKPDDNITNPDVDDNKPDDTEIQKPDDNKKPTVPDEKPEEKPNDNENIENRKTNNWLDGTVIVSAILILAILIVLIRNSVRRVYK